MSERGSREPHKPCNCIECERQFSDQADPELDELIALRRRDGLWLSASDVVLIKELLQNPDMFDREARAALVRRLG